ncbi:hypothetical protein V8E54_003078 [Elaphomyces granulatus]
MYHLPSNWTVQRSVERESEMGHLEYGREKQGMRWTAPPPQLKRQHHSDPLEAPRQAGGEKAPCVHNEPVIRIRLPASVREDNHDIAPCTLEPPLLLSEEILMLRCFDSYSWGHGLELGVGPSKMLATRHSFAEPESLQVPGIPG